MLVSKKTKLKKNKSKSKKQRTFTSSEFSLPEDGRHLSMSELFRNDALKKRQPPPVLAAAPVKKIRSQKQLQTTKKRTKSRSKLRLDKCQTYEVIPYKNSLNSEIVFSNEETKRQGCMDESSSELAIRVNQHYLIDNNRQLRISIKKEYQKKVDAAIKIQKVFRGFLTRKVLQHCMQKQQKKLHQRLAQIRSESVSEHSSYFADKQNNHVDPRRRVITEHQGIFQYSQPINADESQQQQDDEHIAYRHHEPIYSQDELDGLLQSSEEEDDFDQDAFENNIIFETNQQYIDSRKSSQQPKNKLSRPGLERQLANADELPVSTDHQIENLIKTQKKQQRIKSRLEELQVQIREQTLKLNEQSGKSHKAVLNFDEKKQCQVTLKDDLRGSNELEKGDCISVQRLKEEQVHKWDQIILLVQSQIHRKQIDSSEITNVMQQIMQLSLKNKKNLQINSRFSSPNKHTISDHSLPRHDSKGKLKTLRAQRQYLNNHQQLETIQRQYPASNNNKIDNFQKKKDLINLSEKNFFFDELQQQKKSNAALNPTSPISSFQNTGQLKRFLQGNIQDQHIDQMLKLRQELLKKREIQQMRKLNIDLQARAIDQQTFLSRLSTIQNKYSEEKLKIDRTKEDISRGYRAALRLTKQAVTDAKKLGYDLPISRSVQGLKFKSPLLINDIMIDEMSKRRQDRPKQMPSLLQKYREPQNEPKIHIDLNSQDQQSSDLQFTEEQLRRFRRAQPYDIELAEEIADLGRNVMISEQLLRQQQAEQQNQLMKTQHVFRQIYQIEQSTPPRSNPHVDMLSEWIINAVIWQSAGQFLLRPIFSQRLIDKSQFQKPLPVSDKERLQFLGLLQKNFSSIQVLNAKLNQKISPLPSELLRCMRIDFSQQDQDDNSYQQIGKYQFIIGQDVCNEAIRSFRQQIDNAAPTVSPATTQIQKISKQFEFSEKLLRYLQQRQKYICNRRNHTRQLRWQVLNIEIHCIFDAWNEQLIYLRSQKAGYSGIGLNQLTLSVSDHNWQVSPEQTLNIIAQGRKRLIRTLSLSSPGLVFPQFVEQQDDQLLDQDSKWIFYADQALSYGLQLVYLIEEEIFNEMAKDLRKRMLQFF